MKDWLLFREVIEIVEEGPQLSPRGFTSLNTRGGPNVERLTILQRVLLKSCFSPSGLSDVRCRV